MEKDQLSRKLAVILHADVVGATFISFLHNAGIGHKLVGYTKMNRLFFTIILMFVMAGVTAQSGGDEIRISGSDAPKDYNDESDVPKDYNDESDASKDYNDESDASKDYSEETDAPKDHNEDADKPADQ